jgi:hypothetical protein
MAAWALCLPKRREAGGKSGEKPEKTARFFAGQQNAKMEQELHI